MDSKCGSRTNVDYMASIEGFEGHHSQRRGREALEIFHRIKVCKLFYQRPNGAGATASTSARP